jgi:hypothetical protein
MFDLPWYVYLLQFVAGVFLANGIPHFVQERPLVPEPFRIATGRWRILACRQCIVGVP